MSTTSSIEEQRQSCLPQGEDYVAGRLLPRIGLSGADFTLSVPDRGARSLVLLLDIPGSPPLVVRLVPNLAQFARLYYTTRYFSIRGLPVPRVLWHDSSIRTFKRLWAFVLVEERISGRHLEDSNFCDEALKSAARCLAQVHNVTRNRWGQLWFGWKGGYFRHLQTRTERRLVGLRHCGEIVSKTDIARWQRWFAEWKPLVDRMRLFCLSHMRINLNNLLVSDDNSAYLLDLMTARYASFWVDLVRAHHRWCNDEPEKVALFDAAYFSLLNAAVRGEQGALEHYFHAGYHLAQLNRAVQRIQKLEEGSRTRWWTRQDLEKTCAANKRDLEEIVHSRDMVE